MLDLLNRLYEHLHGLSLRFFTGTRTGSWQLTVLSLFMTAVFLWFAKRVGETRRRMSEQTQTSSAEMSAITQETLSVSDVLLERSAW